LAKKCKIAVLRIKVHFSRKKDCHKVSLCENCQQQSSNAFTGLSIRAKRFAGGRPQLRENFAKTAESSSKTSIFNQYSLVAFQP